MTLNEKDSARGEQVEQGLRSADNRLLGSVDATINPNPNLISFPFG